MWREMIEYPYKFANHENRTEPERVLIRTRGFFTQHLHFSIDISRETLSIRRKAVESRICESART
jgi:hypothetical protein